MAAEDGAGVGLVTELNFHDVLMGRGAPAIDNEGNVRMRRLIATRKPEYLAASKRQEKDQIARQVVTTIKSQGGRFLKKVEEPEQCHTLGIEEGTDTWMAVDEETVLTKVKQALRDRSTEDEDPRPRRRKRVKRGNLVPEDDSDPGEQKMGTEESKNPVEHISQGVTGLFVQQNAVAAANASGTTGTSSAAFGSSISGDGVSLGGDQADQIAALLQQIRQDSSGVSTISRAGLPALPASTSHLLSRFSNDPMNAGRLGNFGAPSSLPPNILSAGWARNLHIDPLLGATSHAQLASRELDRFPSSNEMTMGLRRNLLLQQGLPTLQSKRSACEDIIHEAILKKRFPSSQARGTASLTCSLWEATLILVLCDFGLTVFPTENEDQAPTTTDNRSSWKTFAEKVLQRISRTGDSLPSLLSLANLCNAEIDSVQRTSLLVDRLSRNPQELARLTVMLLAKIYTRGMEPSVQRGSSVAASGDAAAFSLFPSSAAASVQLGTDRDTFDSRVENPSGSAFDIKSGIFLGQWALRLGVVTEGGQAVAFSSEDMRGNADKVFRGIAFLDSQNCRRIFSVIASLTQLREILSQQGRQAVLGALSLFPDRFKPLGTTASWWVTADVSIKDFWLVTTAVETGVSGVLGVDASATGAPRRTLRQSSVSTVDVETRLEQICRFLVSHFESASHGKVIQERINALTALLR